MQPIDLRMQKIYKNGTRVVIKPVCDGYIVKFAVDVSWSSFSAGYKSMLEVEELISKATVLDQAIEDQLREYWPRLEALGFEDVKV